MARTHVFWLLAMGAAMGVAEDSPQEKQESEETSRLIQAELPKWQFKQGDDSSSLMTMEPRSRLRWSNPAAGRVYGDVYFWSREGRPEVVLSLFKAWEPPNGFHVELHSLASGPIAGIREGEEVWSPKSGVEWREVPESPVPAETEALRLLQMREIGRKFAIELKDRRFNAAGELQTLRLLSQPLIRFGGKGQAARDGSLFAFALGTDPEIFLMLEAREKVWSFCLARMNDGAMTVTYDDREIATFERAAERDPKQDPYVLQRVPEEPAP